MSLRRWQYLGVVSCWSLVHAGPWPGVAVLFKPHPVDDAADLILPPVWNRVVWRLRLVYPVEGWFAVLDRAATLAAHFPAHALAAMDVDALDAAIGALTPRP